MTGTPASATRRLDQSRTRSLVKTLWLVNGETTGLDPADRGLAYGDGLFETMAAERGHIRWLDLHLDRLEAGCRLLEIPSFSRSLLEQEIRAHCPSDGRAVVKLIVTRGSGTRGYMPPEPATPTRVLSISDWPDYPSSHYLNGIEVHVCRLRLSDNTLLAGIKHLCRLEQVLAQLELRGHTAQQGLLLDTTGHVVGGTSSNVFAVIGGELATPSLLRSGIKGVMRRAVLEAAHTLGIRAAERDLTLADMLAANELFVTNSLFGIWPIAQIDGQRFPVGPTTRRLMSELGYAHAR